LNPPNVSARTTAYGTHSRLTIRHPTTSRAEGIYTPSTYAFEVNLLELDIATYFRWAQQISRQLFFAVGLSEENDVASEVKSQIEAGTLISSFHCQEDSFWRSMACADPWCWAGKPGILGGFDFLSFAVKCSVMLSGVGVLPLWAACSRGGGDQIRLDLDNEHQCLEVCDVIAFSTSVSK